MLGHMRQMANGAFSKHDLKACEEFLAEAQPAERPIWTAVLARYQNTVEHDPLAALAIAAPLIIGEQKARQWRDAQAEAEQKEADWPAKAKQSRPMRLRAPFPPVEEWSISGLNAECAVEISRAHLALKEYETAMEQITGLGPKLEELARVLAGKCGGDLLLAMQRYDQAVRFYKYALEWLNDQRKIPLVIATETGESKNTPCRTNPPPARSKKKNRDKPTEPYPEKEESQALRPIRSLTADEEYLRETITESLDAAVRLWDIEQYGEDFVLYREAEMMRREAGQYLEAGLAYRETENKFGGTMYGEAARAYRIACLWALADPENAEQARATIQKTEATLKAKRTQQAALACKKFSAEESLALQNRITEHERKLEGMKKAPLGKAAAEAAGEETERFIAENEFGLYRGEAMAEAADYHLEFLHDSEQAAAWYERALRWFNRVEELTVDLDAFKVPEKSSAISAPPPEMKTKDEWGNREWARMESGKLFNQRTSWWYLPYHRMMAQTKKALCYFIMGKKDEALALLNIILEADETERTNYERGMPNSYSRLKADFEQGRMFATADELKSFGGKTRVAIMVADYYYEMEQWKEATQRYSRIDRQMRRDLNLKARAYLDFMLGNCTMMVEQNDDKALKYYGKFRNEYKGAPTWPRAMLAIFAAYQNKSEYDAALNTLKAICRRMPDSEWGKRAYYHQAEFLYSRGQKKEAQKVFEICAEKYAGTWLARGAGQYLEKIKTGKE